jgi:hypothetical protein
MMKVKATRNLRPVTERMLSIDEIRRQYHEFETLYRVQDGTDYAAEVRDGRRFSVDLESDGPQSKAATDSVKEA